MGHFWNIILHNKDTFIWYNLFKSYDLMDARLDNFIYFCFWRRCSNIPPNMGHPERLTLFSYGKYSPWFAILGYMAICRILEGRGDRLRFCCLLYNLIFSRSKKDKFNFWHFIYDWIWLFSIMGSIFIFSGTFRSSFYSWIFCVSLGASSWYATHTIWKMGKRPNSKLNSKKYD